MTARVVRFMPRILAMAAGALVLYQWAVARPLWLDEEMIAINIRDRGFGELAGKLSLGQSAPYGWLVLQRLALLTFGASERALRFVPLLFGLLTIATALWIGRRWLDALSSSVLVLLCSFGQWVTYSFVELKHYSADACFGLLLPALAAWAVETDRVLAWWIVAAVAQLVANGALLVAPLCGVAIVALVLQRRGSAAAVRAAAPAILWLVVFAVNYVFILRPARTNEFLQSYWQTQFPPTAEGLGATLRWLGARLAPFADKPGGTRVGILLWLAAGMGFAAAPRRARDLAVMGATVPVAGWLLATSHLVPFFERLVLWIVPPLYLGVALLSDRTRDGPALDPTWTRGGRALVCVAVAVTIAADVTWVGLQDLRDRPAATNHRLDDRSAVRWLAARQQPGDLWLTTHLALPAIWWYAPGTTAPIVQVGYLDPGPDCHPADLARSVDGATRILVLTGFHFDDVPKQFDDLLLNRLLTLGQVTAYRGFDAVSRATIVDRRLTSRRDHTVEAPGCLDPQPARRW